MRVPVPFLNLRDTIKHIQQKHFFVCRQRDFNMNSRVEKMERRGWVCDGDHVYIPAPASDQSPYVSQLTGETTHKEALEFRMSVFLYMNAGETPDVAAA